MSRAAQLDCQHGRSRALVLTLFLFQKGQVFFPPLPIAALLRRSWRGAGLPLAGWVLRCGLVIFATQKKRESAPRSWRWAGLPLAGWDASVQLGDFCNAKGQREVKITLAFLASHEACRRMAVFTRQQTGSRTRPASREACRRAAVIPRPSRVSLYTTARPTGAVRGQGALPLGFCQGR